VTETRRCLRDDGGFVFAVRAEDAALVLPGKADIHGFAALGFVEVQGEGRAAGHGVVFQFVGVRGGGGRQRGVKGGIKQGRAVFEHDDAARGDACPRGRCAAGFFLDVLDDVFDESVELRGVLGDVIFCHFSSPILKNNAALTSAHSPALSESSLTVSESSRVLSGSFRIASGGYGSGAGRHPHI